MRFITMTGNTYEASNAFPRFGVKTHLEGLSEVLPRWLKIIKVYVSGRFQQDVNKFWRATEAFLGALHMSTFAKLCNSSSDGEKARDREEVEDVTRM